MKDIKAYREKTTPKEEIVDFITETFKPNTYMVISFGSGIIHPDKFERNNFIKKNLRRIFRIYYKNYISNNWQNYPEHHFPFIGTIELGRTKSNAHVNLFLNRGDMALSLLITKFDVISNDIQYDILTNDQKTDRHKSIHIQDYYSENACYYSLKEMRDHNIDNDNLILYNEVIRPD